jgi:DNA-binding IclR family transcriptional regulator
MERYPDVEVILTVRDPGTEPVSWAHADSPASDKMRLPVERKMPAAWRAMNRLWSTRKAEKLAEEIMPS